MLCDLALGLAQRLVAAQHTDGCSGVLGGAGGQLELPELELGQGRLLVRVVSPRVSMHQNRTASLRAVATAALP